MVVDFHTLSVRKVRRRCKKNKKGPGAHFRVSKGSSFRLPIFYGNDRIQRDRY